ncbi:MAG: carboxypeptidase-like regulatory domain-containing protein [Bacteroidetes bacterium]|nr:carboxypeptidase-like regulatory domain-containing protein [Bacteroidota bacterium]
MTNYFFKAKNLSLSILLACYFLSFQSGAQVITGKIINEQNEPVPYATIFVQETKEGTISNTDGNFKLQLNQGTHHFRIRSLGYIQVEKEILLNSDSLNLDIILQQQEFEIKEIKVFPGKEDPAYFIIRKAITKAAYYREKIKHYDADLYIKSNFSFTNIPKLYQNKVEIEGKKLKDFFKENVTYVIESQNKITFDYPNKYNQKVVSKKSSLVGFDEPPVMELMTVSFYEERPNQVISPLSSLALKHYKFQYEGFIAVGDFDVFKIKITPKRKSDELVEGYIYIVDKLWCIYNLDFSTNFEFFKYRIKQQFENLGNENWLPVSHNIDGNFGILGLRGMFYYGASVKYDSIIDNYLSEKQIEVAFNTALPDSTPVRIKSTKERVLQNEVKLITAKEELSNNDVKKVARFNRKILKEQYKDSTITTSRYNNYKIDETKDSLNNNISWDTIRAIPLTPMEIKSYQRADSLVSLEEMETDTVTGKKKKKGKSLFSKIVFGYYDLCKDSLIKLNYDGLISLKNYDWNTVDGFKYKQKLELRLNPDSGKYIYFTPEFGYAINRKAGFGSITGKFINILTSGNTFGFAFGKESRDFKPSPLGIQPSLNSISAWFFAENYMKLYETEFIKLDFSQKIKKNFTVVSAVDFNHFFPLINNTSYSLSDKKEYSPNIPKGFFEYSPELLQQKSFSYTVGLNYRERQRKPWLEESPFLFMNDFYEFNLYFKQGIKDAFSSGSDFSHIDFRFQQQANISPSAGFDWKVNAGYFFNSNHMHFSQFKHFNTSEIVVPFKSFAHTFQLLNDYEFSTNSSYLNVGGEFRSEYLLLRYLSFVNRKTWSESIHLNYLTTPDLTNYWEAGYSLNSLFFVGNIGVFTGFKGSKFESVALKFSISGF